MISNCASFTNYTEYPTNFLISLLCNILYTTSNVFAIDNPFSPIYTDYKYKPVNSNRAAAGLRAATSREPENRRPEDGGSCRSTTNLEEGLP
ncbi:hypothetical protein BEI59_15050 [Eisenbergiella tayi]|uniref:Uncharacterized protein n=1 Tax=Eisenbergiella tayi TaxID=1432052 RepID=A0A1E3UH48_9FIRM|nr:hypothetical protein BEI59_15050 [Eisenbergiella tayi]ODR61863.1 hypothetical protein BEI63_00560 [Eisenbergiella tayi]RJW42330.1 hypothetical protein DXC97_04625 [Lachnospiraceae bacterium TF09-5]